MTKPAEHLRAITSLEVTYQDPSEDGLLRLFEDVERGVEEFFVVERVSDTSGQTYAQTTRCSGDGSCTCENSHDGEQWTVECREGGPDEHWATELTSMREAHTLMTKWAFGSTPGDTELPKAKWTRISFG